MNRIFAAFSILAICTSSISAPCAESSYVQGLKLQEEGQEPAAYQLWDSMSPEDPEYPDALTELQKIHYRRQEWQKFFGYARFYREKVLRSDEGLKTKLRARLISLEAMALAKHCQWGPSRDLIDIALKLPQISSLSDRSELDEVRSYLELHHAYPHSNEAAGQPDKPRTLFTARVFWSLTSEQVARLSHPKNLRVVVENRCHK